MSYKYEDEFYITKPYATEAAVFDQKASSSFSTYTALAYLPAEIITQNLSQSETFFILQRILQEIPQLKRQLNLKQQRKWKSN